jgi:hypothetical protein
MIKVAMSSAKEDRKRKQSTINSNLGDLGERPRQGNVDPAIGMKGNLAKARVAEGASTDSRRKLIAKASKSPAEEKEEERAKEQ